MLQGVDRATYDLDINVEMENDNLRRLLEMTNRLNLFPRIPEPPESLLDETLRQKWIKEKGALVFTFITDNSPLQLDIFLSYPINFNELKITADKFTVDDFEFLVSSKEKLVAAKKHIQPLRRKDRQDIEELEELIENEQ